MEAESLPDDLPVSASKIQFTRSAIPPVITRCAWYVPAAAGAGIAPLASADYINMEENNHLRQCNIRMLPDYRPQGLGRALMQRVSQEALAHQRRLFVFPSTDLVPSGAEFARRMGAQERLTLQIKQLKLAEVEAGLLESWIERARERAGVSSCAF
jgi:GNAT superfamily N-acetyltransferase